MENFYYEIVQEMPGSTEEERISREQFYYDAADPNNLYNITRPSLGPSIEGHNHTAESIAAIKANQPAKIGIRVTDVTDDSSMEYI